MFSTKGTFLPTKIFSINHVVSSVICFIVVLICLYIYKEMYKQNYTKKHIFISSILSCFILLDIIFELIVKNYTLQAIVPISFEFLFCVLMWLSLLKNKTFNYLCKCVLAYIGVGYSIFSLLFVMPSMNMYPIFHIKCLTQLFSASIMLFVGLSLFAFKQVDINKKSFTVALIFVFGFVVDCLVVNLIFNTNYLFLITPETLNLHILNNLYIFNNGLYTIVMLSFYLILIIAVFLFYKLFKFIVEKYNQN